MALSLGHSQEAATAFRMDVIGSTVVMGRFWIRTTDSLSLRDHLRTLAVSMSGIVLDGFDIVTAALADCTRLVRASILSLSTNEAGRATVVFLTVRLLPY